MDGFTTRNMQSSLQKYNKLYIVAFCWTIIDIKLINSMELSIIHFIKTCSAVLIMLI
jgi:hypothetical protein